MAICEESDSKSACCLEGIILWPVAGSNGSHNTEHNEHIYLARSIMVQFGLTPIRSCWYLLTITPIFLILISEKTKQENEIDALEKGRCRVWVGGDVGVRIFPCSNPLLTHPWQWRVYKENTPTKHRFRDQSSSSPLTTLFNSLVLGIMVVIPKVQFPNTYCVLSPWAFCVIGLTGMTRTLLKIPSSL